jgi:succinoglycan biosynthesis protein ExoW
MSTRQVLVRTVSVIIPFYQRQTGILGRALRSVEEQIIPEGWRLEVVLVDDGSPVPARQETTGYQQSVTRSLRLFEQENGGVGAARNRCLDEVAPNSELIAFLDSDDIWPTNHVARAIAAIDAGFDFYFTDNRRAGYHESHYRSPHMMRTAEMLERLERKTGVVELPHEEIIGLCLQEFPCQASTVVYRKHVAPALRFNTRLLSGEDIVFFTELLARSSRVGFDFDSTVECGEGVNIFFGNLGWDSLPFLRIKVDQLLTRRALSKAGFLNKRNADLNDDCVRAFSEELSFHLLRNTTRAPRNAASQFWRLWTTDPAIAVKVVLKMPEVALGRLRGQSSPVDLG